MADQTERLTDTLAKAIEFTCEKISKQSRQIAELGKETRTRIDIRVSFDLSDLDSCVWLPTVSVESTYFGVDRCNVGDLLDIYYRKDESIEEADKLP